MITIIDYGAGNIKSIRNMLKRLGVESYITNNENDIRNAEKLILPGVGHFDHGMKELKKSSMIEALSHKVLEERVPILGICLGAQLLGKFSEEGEEKGLGWLDMKVVKFDAKKMEENLKIPHMGWNYISREKDSKLTKELPEDARFYFVHAYHMVANNKEDKLFTTSYGYNFVSAVENDNIYGVQFHPEKSHKFGMHLLSNFASL